METGANTVHEYLKSLRQNPDRSAKRVATRGSGRGALGRRSLATAAGGTALLGAADDAAAAFSPGVVGTAPYLRDRLYPTMGTDEENPTLVVYVNFLSDSSQYFVQHNLEDVVREYVL
ncbi:hypothetical protein NDO74_20600, partial [Haloferax sp. S2CR25-2]|nr:hypothetical protein [Haloferax sp. S2CR25]MDS0446825.1 hypothetical protein [Haloferax sp. S2CR25-2]